ncbi:S-layer homology domain-containing protein [Paenibacillus caseinilyticus]|uniref:S-layer homology domain-containing protein n=1 Tax=Paenibacillus caseinilyticus TaxID=3098138 RepID=UPI0022B8EA0E|nr:S-layer homology domain-containing protein [Paenibacillus caseinilyticus]MCZ8519505.1 S-layer homology domain-containing protein [Paenibacillus caseinilyticus]
MIKEVSSLVSFTLLFSCLLTPLAAAETGTQPVQGMQAEAAQQQEQAQKGGESGQQARENSPQEGDKAAEEKADKPEAEQADGADKADAPEVKTMSPFKDLEGLPDEEKKRIEALVKHGIFDGISEEAFGPGEKLNRAQFAKIAALVFKLKVDSTLRQSSFLDVLAEDPVHSYALPYIEALKEAGLTTGADAEGKRYNPSGEVTRQELAAFLIRGLKLEKEAEQATALEDDTVSDWAAGYAALAVEKKLIPLLADGTFGGTEAATRKTLALAAYEIVQPAEGKDGGKAEEEAEQPDKVSIVEVKAIKSNMVSVKLDRSVDTTAELKITRKGLKEDDDDDDDSEDTEEVKPLPAFVQWTDEKLTEATMELDVKLEKGAYIVELMGLPDDQMNVKVFEFEAEEERIEKIEITAPSDTLPQSKVIVPYKAINQYKEETGLKASNVNILIGAKNNIPIMVPGSRYLIVDLSEEQPGSQVFVSLLDHKNAQSAQKTFTVGDKPRITKLEAGELKFNDGQSVFKTGFRAFLDFKAWDQYDNRVVDPDVLNSGTGIVVFVNPGDVINYDKSVNNFQDINNDGYPELQLVAFPKLKTDKEVTVHLYGPGGGQEVTKTLKVAAPKTPASVEFYAWDKTLADGDVDKYVELRVKDASGYTLTVNEIVYAELEGQLRISSTGPLVLEADVPERTDSSGQTIGNLKIDSRAGEEGKIRIKEIKGRGPASVIVHLVELNKFETLKLDVREKRVPNAIVTGTEPKDDDTDEKVSKPLHYSIFLNTEAGPMFNVVDQYGENFSPENTNYKVDLRLERTSGEPGAVRDLKLNNKSVMSDVYSSYRSELKNFHGREIKFVASLTKEGSYQLTASLVEVDKDGQNVIRTMSSIVSTAEVVNPKTAYVNYVLDLEDSLFAAGRSLYDRNMISSVTDATYLLTYYKAFGRVAEVRAKNALGTEYKNKLIPILGITSNATKVIGHNNKDKIVGLDSGKAKVTVFFEAFDGEIQSVSKDVVVNADDLYVKESKMNDSDVVKKNGSTVDLNGRTIWDSELVGNKRENFQIRDQYGHTIDYEIPMYNTLLDVRAFIGNVQYIEPYTDPSNAKRDKISLDADFKITYVRNGDDKTKNNIKEFTLYVASAHGIKKKRFILYP